MLNKTLAVALCGILALGGGHAALAQDKIQVPQAAASPVPNPHAGLAPLALLAGPAAAASTFLVGGPLTAFGGPLALAAAPLGAYALAGDPVRGAIVGGAAALVAAPLASLFVSGGGQGAGLAAAVLLVPTLAIEAGIYGFSLVDLLWLKQPPAKPEPAVSDQMSPRPAL